MSDIKMIDSFTLPLHTFEGAIEDDDESNLASFTTNKQDRYAVHAINSHDTLTARVAELEEELNKTTYSYSMVLDHSTGGELSKAYFDHEMVCRSIDDHYLRNENENIAEAVCNAVEALEVKS
jgi:hypothetical protein